MLPQYVCLAGPPSAYMIHCSKQTTQMSIDTDSFDRIFDICSEVALASACMLSMLMRSAFQIQRSMQPQWLPNGEVSLRLPTSCSVLAKQEAEQLLARHPQKGGAWSGPLMLSRFICGMQSLFSYLVHLVRMSPMALGVGHPVGVSFLRISHFKAHGGRPHPQLYRASFKQKGQRTEFSWMSWYLEPSQIDMISKKAPCAV